MAVIAATHHHPHHAGSNTNANVADAAGASDIAGEPLPATSGVPQQNTATAPAATPNLSRAGSGRRLTVVVDRLQDKSFGLTLAGERPCRIRDVAPSAASKSGAKPGFQLLAVDGQDVSELAHEAIIDIFRQCKKNTLMLAVLAFKSNPSISTTAKNNTTASNVVESSTTTSTIEKNSVSTTENLHDGQSEPTTKKTTSPPPPPPPQRRQSRRGSNIYHQEDDNNNNNSNNDDRRRQSAAVTADATSIVVVVPATANPSADIAIPPVIEDGEKLTAASAVHSSPNPTASRSASRHQPVATTTTTSAVVHVAGPSPDAHHHHSRRDTNKARLSSRHGKQLHSSAHASFLSQLYVRSNRALYELLVIQATQNQPELSAHYRLHTTTSGAADVPVHEQQNVDAEQNINNSAFITRPTIKRRLSAPGSLQRVAIEIDFDNANKNSTSADRHRHRHQSSNSSSRSKRNKRRHRAAAQQIALVPPLIADNSANRISSSIHTHTSSLPPPSRYNESMQKSGAAAAANHHQQKPPSTTSSSSSVSTLQTTAATATTTVPTKRVRRKTHDKFSTKFVAAEVAASSSSSNLHQVVGAATTVRGDENEVEDEQHLRTASSPPHTTNTAVLPVAAQIAVGTRQPRDRRVTHYTQYECRSQRRHMFEFEQQQQQQQATQPTSSSSQQRTKPTSASVRVPRSRRPPAGLQQQHGNTLVPTVSDVRRRSSMTTTLPGSAAAASSGEWHHAYQQPRYHHTPDDATSIIDEAGANNNYSSPNVSDDFKPLDVMIKYYDSIHDPLGGSQEPVFREHVAFLKKLSNPSSNSTASNTTAPAPISTAISQERSTPGASTAAAAATSTAASGGGGGGGGHKPFSWTRLVISHNRVVLRNCRGVLASYAPKNIYQTFLESSSTTPAGSVAPPPPQFFGFSTVRSYHTKKDDSESPLRFELYSCHVLQVEPTLSSNSDLNLHDQNLQPPPLLIAEREKIVKKVCSVEEWTKMARDNNAFPTTPIDIINAINHLRRLGSIERRTSRATLSLSLSAHLQHPPLPPRDSGEQPQQRAATSKRHRQASSSSSATLRAARGAAENQQQQQKQQQPQKQPPPHHHHRPRTAQDGAATTAQRQPTSLSLQLTTQTATTGTTGTAGTGGSSSELSVRRHSSSTPRERQQQRGRAAAGDIDGGGTGGGGAARRATSSGTTSSIGSRSTSSGSTTNNSNSRSSSSSGSCCSVSSEGSKKIQLKKYQDDEDEGDIASDLPTTTTTTAKSSSSSNAAASAAAAARPAAAAQRPSSLRFAVTQQHSSQKNNSQQQQQQQKHHHHHRHRQHRRSAASSTQYVNFDDPEIIIQHAAQVETLALDACLETATLVARVTDMAQDISRLAQGKVVRKHRIKLPSGLMKDINVDNPTNHNKENHRPKPPRTTSHSTTTTTGADAATKKTSTTSSTSQQKVVVDVHNNNNTDEKVTHSEKSIKNTPPPPASPSAHKMSTVAEETIGAQTPTNATKPPTIPPTTPTLTPTLVTPTANTNTDSTTPTPASVPGARSPRFSPSPYRTGSNQQRKDSAPVGGILRNRRIDEISRLEEKRHSQAAIPAIPPEWSAMDIGSMHIGSPQRGMSFGSTTSSIGGGGLPLVLLNSTSSTSGGNTVGGVVVTRSSQDHTQHNTSSGTPPGATAAAAVAAAWAVREMHAHAHAPHPGHPHAGARARDSDKVPDTIDEVLDDPYGVMAFREFLSHEYSEENLLFWLSCEQLKSQFSDGDPILGGPINKQDLRNTAHEIYNRFLNPTSEQAVNVDARARALAQRMLDEPDAGMFNVPQEQIYKLMKFDSFPRFRKSDRCQEFHVKWHELRKTLGGVCGVTGKKSADTSGQQTTAGGGGVCEEKKGLMSGLISRFAGKRTRSLRDKRGRTLTGGASLEGTTTLHAAGAVVVVGGPVAVGTTHSAPHTTKTPATTPGGTAAAGVDQANVSRMQSIKQRLFNKGGRKSAGRSPSPGGGSGSGGRPGVTINAPSRPLTPGPGGGGNSGGAGRREPSKQASSVNLLKIQPDLPSEERRRHSMVSMQLLTSSSQRPSVAAGAAATEQQEILNPAAVSPKKVK